MTVLVEESHDLPLVDIAVVTAYGSAHDPPGKEGLARHTLELMRRGAAGKTRAEIDDAFDGLGAEVGPSPPSTRCGRTTSAWRIVSSTATPCGATPTVAPASAPPPRSRR